MSIKSYIYTVHSMFRRQEGVSLLEAVIFIAVLSLIILAIVYSTTLSLKRTIFNQDKLIATRYAEELEEWIRGEKEVNWAEFLARSDATYCMNVEIPTCDAADSCWDDTGACGSTEYTLGETNSLNNGFKRSVVMTTSGSRIDIDITVEWLDGPNTYSVNLPSSLSRWD